MAYNTAEGRASYTASAGQTVFDFVFKIFTTSDIKVYKTPSGDTPDDTQDILTLSTNYTVTIDGDNGGTVTLLSGATAGDTIVIVRDLPVKRDTDYQDNGDLTAATLDNDQNYQTYLSGQANEIQERALRIPDSSVGVDTKIPSAIPGTLIRYNLAGDGFDLVAASDVFDGSNAITVNTIADMESLDTNAFKVCIVKDLDRGGTFIWSATGTANGGTVFAGATGYWVRQYSGAVNVKWFGAKGDGVTDDTASIQSAVAFATLNAGKPLPIEFDEKTYLITDDIVINVKDTTVNANYAQLEIIGKGGYALSNSTAGTVIKCTTANKNIIRICMESSGAYPGGGAGVVTLPLQYLRRLKISNITFQGDFGTPTVNAIAGRGIFQSYFFNCGFNGTKYALLAGKAEATSQELSADGYELDYCERIKFDSCGFSNNITHVHALAADAFEATNCTFNKVVGTTGRHAYFAGCNDTITYRKCLIQPETTTGTAPTTNFVFRDVRGASFDECHFEQIKGNLISTPTAIEVLSITKSLLYSGSALSTSVITATIRDYGKLYLNKNNVIYPSSSANYITISAVTLSSVHVDYQDNRSVTTIGGTTPIAITTNLQGSNLNYGRYGDPLFIGEKVYLWATSTGKLMFSTTKPTTDTNGTYVGEDSYLQGTVSFPGVTVNAGSYASVTLAITGANYSRFIFLSPDVTVGEMVWNANNIGGSSVKVTFHNPTASNITIASGTWKYKIELS